jgi:O-antigen ligase
LPVWQQLLASMFLSRIALSVSMCLFIGVTLVYKGFLKQLQQFIKTPFLVGISLLFLMPFVSGLWSINRQEWMDVVRVKAPLLMMPIAFAGSWQLRPRQWKALAIALLLFTLFGTIYSLFYYLQDVHAINESYLSAKVMTTPLGNDHIRISLLVSIAILVCLLLIKKSSAKKYAVALFVLAAFFAVYLHILAARTELFSFYAIAAACFLWIVLKKGTKKTFFFLLCFPYCCHYYPGGCYLLFKTV